MGWPFKSDLKHPELRGKNDLTDASLFPRKCAISADVGKVKIGGKREKEGLGSEILTVADGPLSEYSRCLRDGP